ncbi:NmrA-like family protein [compost metagenome]
MKLLILGATGRVGKEILTQALGDGHRVHILVRSPEKLTNIDSPDLTITQGDACVSEDVFHAVQGADAVISALGTDGGTTLTDSTPLIIKAMLYYAVRRIVTVGTAGILDSQEHPGLLRYETPDTKRSSTRAAEEHRHAWDLLAGSELDWTVVCPTYLPLGERTGDFRTERDYLPAEGQSISVYDTADYAYKQLFSIDHIRARVGIAY